MLTGIPLQQLWEKIRALDEDVYGYIAGQGSSYIVNTVMASTDEGKAMLESELTEDTINSDEFANAFKTAAKLDQDNGSEHTTDDNGNLMAEFNTNGKAGVLFNGVWNASGIDASLSDVIEAGSFPGKHRNRFRRRRTCCCKQHERGKNRACT